MNCIALYLSFKCAVVPNDRYTLRGLTKTIHIFFKAVPLSFNLRALRRLRRVQDFSEMF